MSERVLVVYRESAEVQPYARAIESVGAEPVLEEVRPKTWAVGGYNGTGNIVGGLSARAAARLACGQASPWAEALAAARAHAVKQ